MVTEITSRSILRVSKRVDSWFVSAYGMNLYRGCAHDCAYCDGRAERYRVEHSFHDVAVKVDALEHLERELDPSRRRKPMRRSFVLLGGGVGDAYQPLETRYRLARGVLELCRRFSWPVHVLTKSARVLEDLELLEAIHRETRAVVSFSFSTADDATARLLEPGASPPSARLEAMRRLSARGIPVGAFLLPVIPMITDTLPQLDGTVRAARAAGASFLLFGGMTLKDGRQKDHFLEVVRAHYPEHEPVFHSLYSSGSRWGGAREDYYTSLYQAFRVVMRGVPLPIRMPPRLYGDIVSPRDRVLIILEQLDDLVRLRGGTSTYRRAVRSIMASDEDFSGRGRRARELDGVGPSTQALVQEILRDGTCRLLERLIRLDR